MTDPDRQLIDPPGVAPASANYSPAVRVGNQVFVSGMVAMQDGAVIAPGDAGRQTAQLLAHIETALTAAGARMADIVRYRIYLTDIADLPSVRAELAPVFGAIKPAGTLVAVSALIHPDLKVEIDVDAIIGSALTAQRSATQ